MTRILVFGASGVGKTSACSAYAAAHPGTVHVSASELLRRVTDRSAEELRTAAPDQIQRNQLLLGAELDSFLSTRPSRLVLVDAHSVIDTDHGPIAVPVEIVEGLKPSGIVLLELPIEELSRRRFADSRDRPRRTLTELAALAAAAKDTVLTYRDKIGIPLVVADASTSLSLDEALSKLVSDTR